MTSATFRWHRGKVPLGGYSPRMVVVYELRRAGKACAVVNPDLRWTAWHGLTIKHGQGATLQASKDEAKAWVTEQWRRE